MKALAESECYRAVLTATGGFLLIFGANALSQEPPPPAPGVAEVERVIVTGSNIPSAEEVGPNPVFSINRDLINKSGGGTTTEQLLQRLPVCVPVLVANW